MLQRLVTSALLFVGLALVGGCSTGDAQSGIHIGGNLMRKDSNLRIFLDSQEAKQNKLAKGLKGYSPWTIKDQVAGSPKFKYEIIDVKKFGFIKSVTMAVHQKFEADFSNLADYTIFAAKKGDDVQMKPDVEYDLGNLGPGFKILDKKDNEVPKVEFVPGKEYLLVFTIAADKSETIQVYFKTK
jgi:hypothetical protein